MYIRNGYKYACLEHLAEVVVYDRAEHLHGGRQIHIGVYHGRNGLSVRAQTVGQYLVVLGIVRAGENALHDGFVPAYRQRIARRHQSIAVSEIFVKEITQLLARIDIVTGIHGDLAEEITGLGKPYDQRTETVPKIIEGV